MPKKINLSNTIIILSALIFFTPLQLSYADYDSFTVNVPNDQGGYTAIVIRQSGAGYTGPQGEYYQVFPSISQLQNTYRLGSPAPHPIITYVEPEPEVEQVAPTQVVYQVPVGEDQEYQEDQRYYYHPEPQPYYQEPRPNPPQEDIGVTFFDFKKNKKPQQPQSNKQNATRNTTPSNVNPSPQNKASNPNPKGSPSPDQKKKPSGPGDNPQSKNAQ